MLIADKGAARTASPPPSPPSDRQRRVRVLSFSQKLSRWDLKVSPFLYISPFFLLFAIVGLFPLIYTAVISFMDWDQIRQEGEFIGFDQYAWILSQPKFWIALRNTFSIFLLSSVPQLILALFIATMLDRHIRAKTFWRMSALLPYVVAPVAVGLIFNALYADNSGQINAWLTAIGIGPIPWHVEPFWSHVAISTMVNYRWTGYNALILLAAMQAIPRDYYEAARVDGAGVLRQFWSITLPSLKPTFIFVIITSTIGGLQVFEEPRMFDQYGQGGAASQWLTITLYLYNLGWSEWNFGRAAAMAWLLFLIILAIGLINLLVTQKLIGDAGGRGPTLTRAQRRQLARDQRDRRAQNKEGAR
ncbi:carbohydrate ABC transporter permease [Microbacterium amylolyticum]|uniref:Cellobiose transport system permease protein n=1 Tax=Microbacterium amylolyticum TaxID=936337 RepID=A0ABS4ZHH9_9MICO|nr:sugar ABC transporter permease [Microbacterium amylolyticum]MBP2436440.1 cellobiose transport system permease protein [Microbacterium amylolyticum]